MAAAQRPSIQIGLLAALGRRAGHRVDTLHANVDFAVMVNQAAAPELPLGGRELVEQVIAGRDPYSILAEHRGAMFGEWLFAGAAFGADAPSGSLAALDDPRAPVGLHPAFAPSFLRHIRDELAPRLIENLVNSVDWAHYDMVGFSSTFHQNCASIALAKAIKAVRPDMIIVFGGANTESTMGLELLRSIEAIDLVVQGEADSSFPALLDAVASGDNPLCVPGVVGRSGTGEIIATESAPPFNGLDDQPVPDYTEYFERAARLGLVPASATHFIDVPFESARGCWWGAKRHCTFCGLNGATMEFRSKSADTVLRDLGELARRHGSFQFTAVDNIIERNYFETLLRLLEARDYNLFYEVKADLTPDQLRAMKRAGISRIQPGIESLSSHVLGLMRKGTRAAWNVNLLRWSHHLGIRVAWNLLWGFPGETEEDYSDQAELARLLVHLEPPGSCGAVWFERFSPLFQERIKQNDPPRPERSYASVYPGSMDHDQLAYFFEGGATPLPDSAYRALDGRVQEWKSAWDQTPPELTIRRAGSFVQIRDTRDGAVDYTHTLEGNSAALYAACMEMPRTAVSVADELALPEAKVRRALDALCDSGLSMRDRAHYLSLAVPARRS